MNVETYTTKINNLTVATGLNCTKKQIKGISGLTFLVDEDWFPSNTKYTLPIAFFHMISCKEARQSDVSEKRIILYDSDASKPMDNKTFNKGAVLSVMTDNRINKPKTYSCEILIPLGDVAVMFEKGYKAVGDVSSLISTFGGNKKDSQSAIIQGLDVAFITLKTVKDAISLVSALFPIAKLGFIKNTVLSGAEGYNINSLDKMRDESSFCLFKSWDSWDMKRVSIKSLTTEKKPTEEGFLRGVLELVETPIFTTSVKSAYSEPAVRTPDIFQRAIRKATRGILSFYEGSS